MTYILHIMSRKPERRKWEECTLIFTSINFIGLLLYVQIVIARNGEGRRGQIALLLPG